MVLLQEAGTAANPCVKLQADSLKKRGSVKAETSLSAVEMSGKVMRRGYLLKQVNAASFILLKMSNRKLHFIVLSAGSTALAPF